MTIAELHGKLAEGRTTGYEYMEDLLTSNLFGTMRYAGWECGFLDWLLRAEPAPVEPHPPPIASVLPGSGLVDIQYRFWPRLTNGREPDLALLMLCEDGPARCHRGEVPVGHEQLPTLHAGFPAMSAGSGWRQRRKASS
jgi:hypothetical protein